MYIAIDIGGTKTALASFRDKDPQYKINETVIPTEQNFNQALENIITQIHKLSENQPIIAIGVSIAARVSDNNTIVLQDNIPNYVGKNLIIPLEKAFNTKVILTNDAVCAALAEATYGAGQNARRLLHIIMGTGTGGAFVMREGEKTIMVPLEPGYIICNGANTWGEAVSSIHIQEQLKTPLKNVPDTHPKWKEVAKSLSLGLYNLSVLLNPQIITFSGGLIQKRQFLLKDAAKHLTQYQDVLPTPPLLKVSQVTGNPCLLGALALLSR